MKVFYFYLGLRRSGWYFLCFFLNYVLGVSFVFLLFSFCSRDIVGVGFIYFFGMKVIEKGQVGFWSYYLFSIKGKVITKWFRVGFRIFFRVLDSQGGYFYCVDEEREFGEWEVFFFKVLVGREGGEVLVGEWLVLFIWCLFIGFVFFGYG